MGEWGLPCVVCRKRLRNVLADWSENQPDDGLSFTSHGQYGSTAFDPMDGTYVQVNICDDCITERGEEGLVLTGRDRRPVNIEGFGTCGYERVDRPMVPWRKGLADYDERDEVNFDLEEALGYENDKRIQWRVRPSELKASQGR